MWKWLRNLVMQAVDEEEDLTHELLEAQAARKLAREKLYQTELMAPEVHGVAAWSRSLRRQNHFSARISEALGRVNDE